MTKHWKTQAVRNGTQITLYVTTTDHGIAVDLAAGRSGSFILDTRELRHRRNPTAETDHLDLAVGAFSYHISQRGLTQNDSAVTEVSAMPAGLKSFAFGGTTIDKVQTYAVSVFEEPSA